MRSVFYSWTNSVCTMSHLWRTSIGLQLGSSEGGEKSTDTDQNLILMKHFAAVDTNVKCHPYLSDIFRDDASEGAWTIVPVNFHFIRWLYDNKSKCLIYILTLFKHPVNRIHTKWLQLTNYSMEQSLFWEAKSHSVNQFPASYGTRNFITVFTRARHWLISSKSWAICVTSTPSRQIFLRSILMLPSKCSLLFRFPNQ